MIIIAPDKFKGSMTSIEVCDIIEKGIHSVLNQIKIKKFPFTDGGHGFLEVVNYYIPRLKYKEIKVFDPLLENEIKTKYLTGVSSAYIETAESSGMQYMEPNRRNPMYTSTFGLGQVIADALQTGFKEIYVGLGGSSTTDGGTGLANALGCQFYDINGKKVIPNGKNLLNIHSVEPCRENISASIYGVTDVQNCLYGKTGAAMMFSAQKGATADEIKILDSGLKNLAKIIYRQFSINVNALPGSGAAGGAAAGLHVFANAKIIDGANFITSISGIENDLSKCDLLITGEGKIDDQTLLGKVCYKLAKLASEHNIPVIGITGKNCLNKIKYTGIGFKHIYQLKENKMNEEEAIFQARILLLKTSIKLAESLKI
jgi:glycerate kinase